MQDLEIDPARNLAGFMLSCRFTVLDLDTLEALVRSLPPGWRWVAGTSRGRLYPALHLADGRQVKAARVIAGATEHHEVGTRDGDPFNLTRGNLVLTQCHRRRQPAPLSLVYGPGTPGQ